MSGQAPRGFQKPTAAPTATPPAAPAERRETPNKPGATLDDYRKKAEKVKSEPSKEQAEAIRKLDGSKPTVTQIEGLTALNSALVSVLTKLKKKGVDIAKIKTTKQLQDAVILNNIQMNLAERAAVEELDRVASQSGETAREIKQSWPDRVETAEEASKGYGTKYMEYLKSNPVGTIGLTVAGAAGIYLGYQGIKSLFKWATGSGSDDKEKGSSWFKKEIAIPLVLAGAGAILGKDVVAKMLADAGLDYFKVEDKLKRGKEFTDEEKRKLQVAADQIRQKADEAKAKREGKDVPAEPAPTDVPPPATPAPTAPDAPEGKEEANLETAGAKLLTDAGAKKLDDNTYQLKADNKITYFRFNEEGKWQWAAGIKEKNKNEWHNVAGAGLTGYADEVRLLRRPKKVRDLVGTLATMEKEGVEAVEPGELETESETKLREFGEGLLAKKGAHKLEGGMYLLVTAGNNTYFKFEGGKWRWGSESQKKNLVLCSESPYSAADMQSVNELAEQLVKGPEAKKEGEDTVEGEPVLDRERKRSDRYLAAYQILTNIYCAATTEPDKFLDVKSRILLAFVLIRKVPVSKVISAHKSATDSKRETVTFEELEILKSSGVDEKALFHACAIVSIAFKEAEAMKTKAKPDAAQSTEIFLSELGNDPALEISNQVQDDVAKKISDMKITSLSDLHENAEKVFNSETIDAVVDAEKDKFVEYLANKYGIKLEGLSKEEKAEFIKTVGIIYGGEYNLDLSESEIDQLISSRSMKSPKAKAVTKEFFIKLKEHIGKEGGLLSQCIKRYDITREGKENEKYNQVLSKFLTMKSLRFKDGFQMALLSDGINFDSPTDYESVGQAKDITMLFLMVNILKKRSPREGYPRYVSNLVDLGTKSKIDLKLNINFQKLQPYFQKIYEIMLNNTKNWLGKIITEIEGLDDTNKRADKLDRLEESTVWEFTSDTLRSGARGAYDMPKDLIQVLAGKFPDAIDSNTSGEELLAGIMSLGGTISFPVGREAMGLAFLYGKWYFFKPIGILPDTIIAGIKKKSPGVAFKNYLLGTSPFVILGAGVGFLETLAISHGSVWKAALGGLGGAGKGLVAPAYMPVVGYRNLRKLGRGSKYAYNYFRGRTVANLEQEADMFLKYDKLSTSKSAGWGDVKDAWIDDPYVQAKRLFLHNSYSKMRLWHAHYFSVNYNHFWGLKVLDSKVAKAGEGVTLKPIDAKDWSYFSTDQFREKVERTREITAKMREIKNIGTLTEEEFFKAFQELKLTKPIEAGELNALRKRAAKEGFESFRKSLAKDIKALAPIESGPGFWSRMKERFSGKKSVPSQDAGKGTPAAPQVTPTAEPAEPTNLGKGKYGYNGEEYSITEKEINKRIPGKKSKKGRGRITEAKRKQAIRDICEERWQNNFKQVGETLPNGDKVFRFRGQNFTLNAAESLDQTSIRNALKAKYNAAKGAQAPTGTPSGAPAAPATPAGVADATKPTDLGNGKFRYMDEEMNFEQAEIDEMMKKGSLSREQAIEKMCKERWSSPQMVKELSRGRKVYRLRGAEFTLSAAELEGADAKAITTICDTKFAKSLAITDGRVVAGAAEFKIGEKWVKVEEGPGAMEQAKKDYIEAAKKAGYQIDYNKIANSKLLKYFKVLESSVGPALAVVMIYQMETAKDKRKAIAETSVCLGSFWAGSKAAERATRAWTPKSVVGTLGKGGIILMTGLATAMGVTEPVSSVLEDLIPKFAGDQQISLEMVSLFEKWTTRSLAMTAMRKLEQKVVTTTAKEILEKKGLQTLAKLLGKKVESTVLKKIATFVSKPLLEKLAVSLGVRGVVLAGLVADDASVIGVIDDVVAVGMAAWMAKDIYDVAVLANRALNIKSAMEEFNKMPIADIKPAGIVDEKAIEAALAARNLNMEDLTDEELMEVIRSIPDIRLRITRQGSTGYEEYRFVKGEVFSTKIKTKEGEILELSDEELNQEIAVGPPEDFKTWEIDYNQPKEKLEANYRMAILYTKSECGWTKLDFEIQNENTIVVKRLDGGNEETTITREGSEWSVGGYTKGHTLFQALVLANLTNKVHGIFVKEEHTAGSDQPFELDGDNIDFDKNWNPNDLRILSAETGWLKFYDTVGVSKQEVVDTLNAWYKAEYKAIEDTY